MASKITRPQFTKFFLLVIQKMLFLTMPITKEDMMNRIKTCEARTPELLRLIFVNLKKDFNYVNNGRHFEHLN